MMPAFSIAETTRIHDFLIKIKQKHLSTDRNITQALLNYANLANKC